MSVCVRVRVRVSEREPYGDKGIVLVEAGSYPAFMSSIKSCLMRRRAEALQAASLDPAPPGPLQKVTEGHRPAETPSCWALTSSHPQCPHYLPFTDRCHHPLAPSETCPYHTARVTSVTDMCRVGMKAYVCVCVCWVGG